MENKIICPNCGCNPEDEPYCMEPTHCPMCGTDLSEDIKEEKICATCGLSIEGNYYKIGDNFLQVKYFDDEETENVFCSKECLCQALSVLEVDEDGEAFPV